MKITLYFKIIKLHLVKRKIIKRPKSVYDKLCWVLEKLSVISILCSL